MPAEAGYGVEADPNPPRLMGAPFAADLHARHCYAILPAGQVRLPGWFASLISMSPGLLLQPWVIFSARDITVVDTARRMFSAQSMYTQLYHM